MISKFQYTILKKMFGWRKTVDLLHFWRLAKFNIGMDVGSKMGESTTIAIVQVDNKRNYTLMELVTSPPVILQPSPEREEIIQIMPLRRGTCHGRQAGEVIYDEVPDEKAIEEVNKIFLDRLKKPDQHDACEHDWFERNA